MNRQTIYSLAMILILAMSTAAHAQITSVGLPGLTQSSSNGGILDEVSLVTLDVVFDNANPAANSIQAELTGDINFTPQEGLAQAFYSIAYGFDVTIGQIPVDLFNVAFIADAKLVNGGGTNTNPLTLLTAAVSLSQVNPNIIIDGAGVGKQIQGNGFEFVQGSPLMAPYVLAAGETYRFDMAIFVDVNTIGLFNDPTSVISHEFGGVTAFDGYRLSILAAAVPEPASLGLMGLGGLALVRRGRRSDPLPANRVVQMKEGNL
jgi:PEP-CTERM motif-containing protein